MIDPMDADCVKPDWQVDARVRAFTTTRHGGVSKPPYQSMNLGLHVGDDRDDVERNRVLLHQRFALPCEPRWLKQTHGTKVINASNKPLPQSEHPVDADGIFTRQRNVVLAVLTADCLPVVISDVNGTQLAVVHAGWRGLAAGIISNAVKMFHKASTLHAWLGPAIGPDNFEVGEDVRQAFLESADNDNMHFRQGMREGKYLANLYTLAQQELNLAGCIVTGGDYCTYAQKSHFHSHRRDGAASGRMATVAWLS